MESSKCGSRQQQKGSGLLPVLLIVAVSKSLPLSHSQNHSVLIFFSSVVLEKGLPRPALTMTQCGKNSKTKDSAVVCILNSPSWVHMLKTQLLQSDGEMACDGGGAQMEETSD